MSEVTVVSYGAGNVASVQFALERLGATVRLTADPAEVAGAERLILPGVGAACYAMARLSDLGLIPGTVRRLEPGPDRTVPHMGWSRLTTVRPDPLLEGIGDEAWAYFVHSYVCPDGEATLARAAYGGSVPAMVRSANRWGCQFHPERSAAAGARILRNFLDLAA